MLQVSVASCCKYSQRTVVCHANCFSRRTVVRGGQLFATRTQFAVDNCSPREQLFAANSCSRWTVVRHANTVTVSVRGGQLSATRALLVFAADRCSPIVCSRRTFVRGEQLFAAVNKSPPANRPANKLANNFAANCLLDYFQRGGDACRARIAGQRTVRQFAAKF